MDPNQLRLLIELSNTKGCKFTSITYRSASTNEVARHTLLFGVDYRHALERDLKYLQRLHERLKIKKNKTGSTEDVMLYCACEDIIESKKKSLAKYDGPNLNNGTTEDEIYTIIIPGVKQHKQTGEYYIYGFRHRKEVIQSGIKSKPVKSKPLTTAKEKIRAKLRTDNYVNFKLSNITKIALNNNILTLE